MKESEYKKDKNKYVASYNKRQHDRRMRLVEKASCGCWWVRAYIIGRM